jgi:predicted homoserine dehydrogenase-like protein
MNERLRQREASGQPIEVALVGAGAMGVGIAWQIARTPGMRLACVVDLDLAAARRAADAYGAPSQTVGPGDRLPARGTVPIAADPFDLIGRPELRLDVLVEATNTIGFAGRLCEAAIDRGLHVVLMNAEVDLALGPQLVARAERGGKGAIVTSDGGDQHGVLARMIDEIELWGFRTVMAGNIKGFLDRHATAASLAHEAAIRNLNPVQCCAYTDGTKLGVEMALLANGYGLVPWLPGMEGPRVADVRDVFQAFDFHKYGSTGVVDYILGAEPGGGVFVVGQCDDPLQQRYLQYYKLGDGPFYLFYRPYHLCHLETPRAIARAVFHGEAVLQPRRGRVADVYAYAKRDAAAGEDVPHGIGGDHCYGLIERAADADAAGHVPIALLDVEAGEERPRIRRNIAKDMPLTWDDIVLPDSWLVRRWRAEGLAVPAA